MHTDQSFNVAKVRSDVSADSGSVVNDGGSHLFSQIFEVVDTERFDVLWWVNINEFHLIFPQKIEPSQKESFPLCRGGFKSQKGHWDKKGLLRYETSWSIRQSRWKYEQKTPLNHEGRGQGLS